MKLLALETSTENCSVALKNNEKIVFRSISAAQKHAEMILPMIDEVLKEAKVSKDELDGIVLSTGPGSFTGVRIAASTAQGIALALDKKVALVTSLKALAIEALSNTQTTPDYIVSSIDARMGEVYFAVYKLDENRNLTLLDEERVLKPVDAVNKVKELVNGSNNLIGAGTGIAIINEASTDGDIAVLESIADFPKAQYILTEGQRKFETGDIVEAQDALPLYVRNEVTWKKVSEQH